MKKHTQSPCERSEISYKPSSIKWLGEIPKHWEVTKFKYFYRSNMGETILTQDLETDGIPVYSATEEDKFFGKIKNPVNILNVNDFVIPARGTIGAIKIVKEKSTCTQTTIFSKQFKDINPYYVYYFLLGYRKFLFEFIQTAIPQITISQVNENPIILPPLQEQKEIAEFLDSKCEKIQNYIDKKQKLITLLQEKKQALINEAVTKGLNPNIESKNSGIEYLGLIPHHWEVRRVATLGKFFKGSNISKNDLQNSGVSVVLYGDIYTKYEIKTKQFQSKIAESFAKDKTQILFGDLLFSGSGETKEDIGKCICYLGNEKAYVGGDVIVLRQMGQDSLFLSYVLNSDYIKYQKAVISKGEIIIHIYASNLRDLKIPLPPLHEQKEIAEFLDSKVAQIDSVIEKTKKQIELVKEYKNTLINEAVCGRINLERK
ncbi:restriction endonuclease subunit S [Campylobacter upsaliensis]